MRVDIEDVRQLHDELWQIDRLSFDVITWYYDGKPLEVPKEIAEEYKMIGLRNSDFVRTDLLDALTDAVEQEQSQ